MKRLLEQSLSLPPFLKRLGIIVIALLLAIITNYFIPGAGTFICFLILGSIVGYLSSDRKDVLINGILFGAFFLMGINILNSKAYFNLGGIIRTIILIPIFGTLPGITVSAIGYLMKDKVIKWFAFIIIILSSLETWCGIYLHTSQLIMLSVSTILLPFLFCLRTNLKIWKASFLTTIVGILGTLAILIIDIHKDPTSHNCFRLKL